MRGSDDQHLPDELEPIASVLRQHRARPEALELDRLKQRVLTRRTSRPERWTFMRSRIVTVLTAVGLIAGGSGALALANSGSPGANAAASRGQYCPPKSHLHHGKCKPPHHHHHHHGPPPPHHHHHGPPPGAPAVAVVATRDVTPFGPILVNGAGDTLYAFTADNQSRVSCTGTCATFWPPDFVPAGGIVAGPGVNSSLLGSDADPTGGSVVSYNGWPLYTFSRDSGPGSTAGQGQSQFGGTFYVVSPSGNLIKTR
jgi:predicted lipoprotein with Yx(FWY)xxD motif